MIDLDKLGAFVRVRVPGVTVRTVYDGGLQFLIDSPDFCFVTIREWCAFHSEGTAEALPLLRAILDGIGMQRGEAE